MCTICINDQNNGEEEIALCCGHKFHIACIKPWIRTQTQNNQQYVENCPNCRRVLSGRDRQHLNGNRYRADPAWPNASSVNIAKFNSQNAYRLACMNA